MIYRNNKYVTAIYNAILLSIDLYQIPTCIQSSIIICRYAINMADFADHAQAIRQRISSGRSELIKDR